MDPLTTKIAKLEYFIMNKGIFSLPTLEFEDILSGEFIVAELNMV